jgi:hypothetical protein
MNSAPWPGPSLRASTVPHQGQPEPKPARRPVPVGLGEHVEHPVQHVGRDADPGVPDLHHRVAPLPLGRQGHPAAAVGVSGRIVQQVRHHLGQPGLVPVQRDRPDRRDEVQLEPGRLDQRPARLNGRLDNVGQVDPGLPQLQLAGRDPGQVEQIVHQPGELPGLPLDDGPGPDQGWVGRPAGPEDLDRVLDGGQRVAQLVGQDGQKLVLLPVGLPQAGAQAGVLDGLDGLPGEQVDQVGFPPARFAGPYKVGGQDADDPPVAGEQGGTVDGPEPGPAGGLPVRGE